MLIIISFLIKNNYKQKFIYSIIFFQNHLHLLSVNIKYEKYCPCLKIQILLTLSLNYLQRLFEPLTKIDYYYHVNLFLILFNCLFIISQLPIYSTNPNALQEVSLIQLPKMNIANYNNSLLPTQCTDFPTRCIPKASFL